LEKARALKPSVVGAAGRRGVLHVDLLAPHVGLYDFDVFYDILPKA
jgi:hypothetical protein